MDSLFKLFTNSSKLTQPPKASGGEAGPLPQGISGIFGNANTKPYDNVDPNLKSPLYDMFNTKLSEFLDALVGAIPENEALKAAYKIHLSLAQLLPGEPLKRWLSAIDGHSDVLAERTPENEAKFLQLAPTLEYIKELEITKYWHELADEAQDNVWDHLRQLDSIAQTLGNFTPQLLTTMHQGAADISTELNDDMTYTDMTSHVLQSVVHNEALLKLAGVDPEYAQQPEVAEMATQLLGMVGSLGLKD
jgi:hypothetical protein